MKPRNLGTHHRSVRRYPHFGHPSRGLRCAFYHRLLVGIRRTVMDQSQTSPRPKLEFRFKPFLPLTHPVGKFHCSPPPLTADATSAVMDTEPKVNRELNSHQGGLTVSGLLAGFSFAAVLELTHRSESTLLDLIMFFAFTLSTFLLLIGALGFWATIEWISEYQQHGRHQQTKFYRLGSLAFFFGIIVFSAGVGLVGFAHSLPAGVATLFGATAVPFYLIIVIKEMPSD